MEEEHYDIETLPNGARIVTEAVPAVRSVSLGLWVATGSRHEKAGESGAAHFIEHMVFKGTQRRSARELAQEMDAIGGQVNAYTTKECTCFYARCLDEHLPRALDLLCDMVFDSKFDQADVDTERGVILEEIGMYEDTPELLKLAMEISWTQNVVILEADMEPEERRWYLRAAGRFGWSKAELQRKIDSAAHLEIQLDELEIQCYTELNRNDLERTEYDQDTFPLSRQYLQKSDGRVYYERFGEKGRFGTGNYYRIGSYQHRRDWKSCLSTGPPQAGRA